jgi:hypothetical protein
MRVARTYRWKLPIDKEISRMAKETGMSKTFALEMMVAMFSQPFIDKYKPLLSKKKASK